MPKSVNQEKFEALKAKASYYHHKYNPGDKIVVQFINPRNQKQKLFDYSNIKEYVCVEKSYHECIWPGCFVDDLSPNPEHWDPITIKVKDPLTQEIDYFPVDMILSSTKRIVLALFYSFLSITFFMFKFMVFSSTLSALYPTQTTFENYTISSLFAFLLMRFRIDISKYYSLDDNIKLWQAYMLKFIILDLILFTIKHTLS